MDGIELVDSKNPPENAAICRCSDDPKPHVHYLCDMALAITQEIQKYNKEKNENFSWKIGIAMGPPPS